VRHVVHIRWKPDLDTCVIIVLLLILVLVYLEDMREVLEALEELPDPREEVPLPPRSLLLLLLVGILRIPNYRYLIC